MGPIGLWSAITCDGVLGTLSVSYASQISREGTQSSTFQRIQRYQIRSSFITW